MRLSAGLIVACSFVMTAATVANAFLINKQFYPSVVYITKSNPSLAVVYFQALILVYLTFQFVRHIFFGDLRASESEHLTERAWHAVMETCLAFTVFRDDFSTVFVMQFVLLLFVKSFHWLSDDRVDMMERSPVITLKFHLRMLSLIGFLAGLDSYMVSHAYFSTVLKGASAQIVFGFEYAILLTMVAHVSVKYILHMHDLRSASQWENKTVYLLYTELLINLMRVVLYLAFVLVMLRVHTFPLFSIRPFFLSIRAFHKALTDVLLSRRAINAMNNLFPVVTAEELATMDATCIICREEMTHQSRPKRLPCGHVFHAICLRSWFQRQQTCPTCRTDILSRAATARGNGAANGANAGGQQGGQGGAAAVAANQLPANMFPFMAHQFAFPPPFAPPNNLGPGQQQGQAQPNQQPAVGQTNANQENAQGPAAFPGMVPPPFFLPPPPFNMPFPPSFPPPPFAFPAQPTFSGLTDQELAHMEGETRRALEARVRVLHDISTLLDAAVFQMQQYISVIGPSATTVNLNPNGSVSSAATEGTGSRPSSGNGDVRPRTPSPVPSSVNLTQSMTPNPNSEGREQEPLPGPSTSADIVSDSSGTSARTKTPTAKSLFGSTPTSPTSEVHRSPSEGSSRDQSEGAGSSPLDEIRQRRLQRFADNE